MKKSYLWFMLLPFLYAATCFGIAEAAIKLRGKDQTTLTCPEAARVLDAASRSNGVHWSGVSCSKIEQTGPHDWKASLSVDDGSGTIREWSAHLSLDQYIITSAIQTGSHTIPSN